MKTMLFGLLLFAAPRLAGQTTKPVVIAHRGASGAGAGAAEFEEEEEEEKEDEDGGKGIG